jgi:hypothetical protein
VKLDFFRDMMKFPLNPITGKRLNATQERGFQSRARYKWWSGNRGGSKTTWLVAMVAYLALAVKNNRILLGRKYYAELHTSLLQTWRDWIKEDVFNIEYDGGKNPRRAIFRDTGSEVWFVGFDRDARWLGNEIGTFAIDQAEQIDEEKFLTLQANLRWRHTPESMMFGLCVGNPRGHFWAYKKFVEKKGLKPEHRLDYDWFKNPPRENVQNLKGGDRYYDELESSYPPYLRERMLLGSDDAVEGLALPAWNPGEGGNLREFTPESHWQPYVVYDHGFYPSPAIFLLCWHDPERGVGYVEDEISALRYTPTELVDALKEKAAKLNFPLERAVYVADPQVRASKDSAGKSVHQDFAELGILFENADKRVGLSLQRMNGYLVRQKHTGDVALVVHTRCGGLADACSSVTIDPERTDEKLDGEGVDFIDALRYFIMRLPAAYSPETREDIRGTWEEVEKYETFTAMPRLISPSPGYPDLPPGWASPSRPS